MQADSDKYSVERWWPNGMGQQRMYAFTVYLLSDCHDTSHSEHREMSIIGSTDIRVGARDIRLVRQPLPGSAGETFEFHVNGVPMFVKGRASISQCSQLHCCRSVFTYNVHCAFIIEKTYDDADLGDIATILLVSSLATLTVVAVTCLDISRCMQRLIALDCNLQVPTSSRWTSCQAA